MTQAFLIDALTGETVQRMEAPEESLDLFTPPDGFLLVKLGDGAAPIHTIETYMDDTLKVRERTVDEAVQLAVMKVKAREKVNARRAEAEAAGCETIRGKVDTDPDSQRRLHGAAVMALISKVSGAAYSVEWRMADNTDQTLSADELLSVVATVGTHIASCHVHSHELKAAIDSAANEKDLSAIDLSVGWPDDVPNQTAPK